MADGTVKASASSRGKAKTTPKRGKQGPAKPAAGKAAPKAKQARKRKAPEAKPDASQAETQQGQFPAQAVNPPLSQIPGQIVWLAMHSATHKHLFLTDLEWLVIPPRLLKKFRVFHKNGKTFPYINPAFVVD